MLIEGERQRYVHIALWWMLCAYHPGALRPSSVLTVTLWSPEAPKRYVCNTLEPCSPQTLNILHLGAVWLPSVTCIDCSTLELKGLQASCLQRFGSLEPPGSTTEIGKIKVHPARLGTYPGTGGHGMEPRSGDQWLIFHGCERGQGRGAGSPKVLYT